MQCPLVVYGDKKPLEEASTTREDILSDEEGESQKKILKKEGKVFYSVKPVKEARVE